MLNGHRALGKYILFNRLVNDYHWRGSNSIRCKCCHSSLSLSCRYRDASLIHTHWFSVLCRVMQCDNIWRKWKAVPYQFNVSNLNFQLILREKTNWTMTVVWIIQKRSNSHYASLSFSFAVLLCVLERRVTNIQTHISEVSQLQSKSIEYARQAEENWSEMKQFPESRMIFKQCICQELFCPLLRTTWHHLLHFCTMHSSISAAQLRRSIQQNILISVQLTEYIGFYSVGLCYSFISTSMGFLIMHWMK